MEEINKREKRGLINMVGHVQKTLFGTLDDEDGETYNTQIRELQNSRVGMLKIIDKQTSILKLTNSAFKDAQGMEIQLKSLNITCKNLETSLKRVWDQIDLLEIRTTITNLITTLLLLLQQLVFETDMVGEIIFAAQNGIIHSGIISTRELRMQLRDILISLPGQLKLPFDVNAISLYELSKTSKLAIVYMNGTLVFELIIPLLNPVELTLYHMIPLPVRREKLYMHLTPEFEYMAISKTHEYYLTISVTHLMKCTELTSITMCPETQPLRIGSAGLPCEVELFMKPTVVPATCTVKYLELTRSIYHKLKYHNKWIYIINTLDDVAVTCDQSDNAKNIQLRGVGILTLSEQCRAHTPQVVLTPSRHLKSVQYLDFIPPVNIPSVKIPLVPSFKFDNLLNHQTSIIKLNHISDFSKTIEELENAVQDEKNRSILQTTSASRGNTPVANRDIMLRTILTRIRGQAYEVIRYEEITSCEMLKTLLKNTYDKPINAAYLQIELFSAKQRYKESLIEYATRIRNLVQAVSEGSTQGKSTSDALAVKTNIREQALLVFLEGINDKIKVMVKSKNPSTLEQAIQIAIIEDKNITHLMKCRELASITMCPEKQPLRIGSAEPPCEVELFMKPTVVPATCAVKYLELTRSIYHKLKYHNKWIYIINTLDDVAVTCDQSDNAKNIQLRA
ncbi:hypothetical protein QTP88_011290 [Uroleucon formosanum]